MSLLHALAQGTTVVAVSERLARHLRWRFDRAQAAVGKAAWPSADILSWNAWLERLYLESALAGGDAGRYDLLTRAQSRLVWHSVIDAQAGVTGGRSATGMALEAWRQCGDWRIRVRDLHAAAFNPDTEAFAAWARAYEERCRAQGWIDTSVLPDPLLADLGGGRIAVDAPVWFAGFDAPTAQQVRMIDAVPSKRCALEPHGNSSVLRVACSNPRDEIERAARWARAALERSPGDVIGLVVPDAPQRASLLRRTFLDVLVPDWRSRPRRALPVNTGRGESLAANGLVHTALLILQLAEPRIDYRDLGQLLRSPYLGGGVEEAAGRASLDLKLRDEGRFMIDTRWVASSEAYARLAPRFVTLVQSAMGWVEQATGYREPSGWAVRFTELLGEMGWPEGRALNDDERQALKAWKKLLDAFASSSRVVGELKFGAACQLLATMAREQLFQVEERMDGVQIMSPNDAIGHEFDGLWVCGLSSDAWPPAARPNPLIALDLQRRVGIPEATPQRIRQLASDSMRRLWTAAPEVYVSWARENEQGELIRSPILDALTDTDPTSLEQHGGETLRANLFARRCLEASPEDPAPPLRDGMVTRGGSRLMKLQGACPARAFFEFRLGAKEMPMPVFGIDARERGNIIHHALELMYTEIVSLGGLAEVENSLLDELIQVSSEEALQRHFGGRDPFSRTLLENEANRMQRLLAKLIERERQRPPFKIESTEQTDTVTVGPLQLRLRQDRVDRIDDGRRLVIDYKTGVKLRISDWAGERPAEPQLPLYAATAEVDAIAVITLNQDGVDWNGVGPADFGLDWLQVPGKVGREKPVDWDALVLAWKQIFQTLAEEFAAGDMRIDASKTQLAEGEFAMLTRIFDRP